MRTPGQITVFLSLILTLMISFLMALFQNAYIESSKSEARMASTMAMESVFGEYHKEALEQYDVFLLDGSYRSGSFSEEAILSHYSDFLSYQTDMNILLDPEYIFMSGDTFSFCFLPAWERDFAEAFHEKIGKGSLGLEAVTAIINHPKLRNLPFYLETPNELDGYQEEIALLKSLRIDD